MLGLQSCSTSEKNFTYLAPADGTLDIEKIIPWHCKTDVDRVAMDSQDPRGNITRSLQLVAEARFDAFQANLPDLAVLGHIVEPMKVIKD
jgi:hypothetical protein